MRLEEPLPSPPLSADDPADEARDLDAEEAADLFAPPEPQLHSRAHIRVGRRFVSIDTSDLARAERSLSRGFADRARWRIR